MVLTKVSVYFCNASLLVHFALIVSVYSHNFGLLVHEAGRRQTSDGLSDDLFKPSQCPEQFQWKALLGSLLFKVFRQVDIIGSM